MFFSIYKGDTNFLNTDDEEEILMRKPKNEFIFDRELQGVEEFSTELIPSEQDASSLIQEVWEQGAEKSQHPSKKKKK